jgi:membrane AbrB-like protein
MRRTAAALVTLAAGFLGGLVFAQLGAPLPWTLGAMAAVALGSIAGRLEALPPLLGSAVRPVVGVLAGSTFTAGTVGALLGAWDLFAVVIAFSILGTALGYLFLRRIGRLDPMTAFLAAAPGGLGEITLLGIALKAAVRPLVLIHTIRIVAVIVAVPVAVQLLNGPADWSRVATPGNASATLADWLILAACGVAAIPLAAVTRFPGGVMVPAMILSAIVHAIGLTHAAPPVWTVILVQIVIGAIAGARFAGVTWAELQTTVLLGLGWAAVLLAFTFGSAWLASFAFEQSFTTLLLALAPGGMVEMTVVVYAIGIDVALVITCQITRIFTVLSIAPLLSRFFRGPAPPD